MAEVDEDEEPFKIGEWDGEGWHRLTYPDVYAVETTTGPERLVIAPALEHVGLLAALAGLWGVDCYILYVLVVSRTRGAEGQGRYQSPGAVPFVEVTDFCARYQTFLEGDGRHHLWLHAEDGTGTLVYDRHDVIYAYGDLPRYVALLEERGFRRGEVRFPTPHSHLYHPEYDAYEAALLNHWDWGRTPLRPDDE
jgi:hypothetical protein